MPLQRLKFTPGVNRESTTLANEGGWYECDKIRFRSGYPEKIGGWVLESMLPYSSSTAVAPPSGSYWGVCRSMWVWTTLNGRNLLGMGTNLKFYIEDGTGGVVYNVTPIRLTTAAGDVTFAASAGQTTLTVTDVAHGATPGDFVTFSGATSLGGNITATVLNREYRIVTVPSADTYTVEASVAANGSDSGNGGAAVVAAYQLNVGSEITTNSAGWGAGGWGGETYGEPDTGWGESETTALAVEAALWSQSNYGENLIINPRYGALYMQVPNAISGTYDRAVLLASTSPSPYTTDADCPSVCNWVMVSPESRFVIAFGTNDYGSSTQDPLLIRWSAQEDYTTWTPAPTNQAGSFRLSYGSELKTAVQMRQETLVFTDAAVYSMQYLGPPYVWGFNMLDGNISLAGPNVVAVANNVAYWMGNEKFYTYSGRVETLPCTLRQYIFEDINVTQRYQFFACTNEGYNEVWWFYCSANSDTIDRYVIYNHLERIWMYGTLARTAWIDSALRPYPLAAAYDGIVVQHENGVDDATTGTPAAIESYIQSADFDIGDGHNYGFVWRMIPDVTFDGSDTAAPSVDITVRSRRNPGATYHTDDPQGVVSVNNYSAQRTYTVQQFTQIVYMRARGRQMAFKIASSDVGVQWQLGAPSIDIRPDGRAG